VTNQDLVEMWMEERGQLVARNPALCLDVKMRFDRSRLIMEEPFELFTAIHENVSLEKVADGVGDSMVVIYGAAAIYGLDADECFRECMRSNFTKSALNQHSKGGKGPGFRPPNFTEILKPWRK
jgi:hypothetical protein